MYDNIGKYCEKTMVKMAQHRYSIYADSSELHYSNLAHYILFKCVFNTNLKIVVAGPVFRYAKYLFNYIEKTAHHYNTDVIRNYYIDHTKMTINGNTIIGTPIGRDGDKVRALRPDIFIALEFDNMFLEPFENICRGFSTVQTQKNNGYPQIIISNSRECMIGGNVDKYLTTYTKIIDSKGDIEKLIEIFNEEVNFDNLNYKDYAVIQSNIKNDNV